MTRTASPSLAAPMIMFGLWMTAFAWIMIRFA